ncbi:hypothetical protein D1J36_007650 [Riemerella anatipestifer]|uniref:FISUMP domain-containing protein n=1 Tax=Riemerella anatipestifer TaxID=34085 RepID=UPI0012ADF7F3|nr:FISUMP domain-containing protein [Riemerella anatipestifer]MDY3315849.1 FISUMP domain-containing protein [Riemerella anatipestifer]MDY3520950.1 FISUMP domain-containing protein [Riemerella anatipestifer]MDY3533288.1 FISUMP domain-containing protein [Riemerella anatipestifer]USL95151.1 hypothetical protein D1J36_007650 [Riemerella anatipestifer]
MKKTLLCAVFLPLVLNAQEDYRSRVGINTNTPQATLEISRKELNTLPKGYPQGVLFPEFTTEERLTFSPSTKKGTLIYNKEKNCIEMYRGFINGVHEWTCTNTNVGSEVSNPFAPATATLGVVQDIKWIIFKNKGKNYLLQGSSLQDVGIAAGAEIIVNIPYSDAQPANGAYTAYEQTLALKNESGYMQDFKLSYPAGNFTGSSGTIPAKLKNVSGATYYPALAPEDGIYRNVISNANAYTISLNGSSTTTLRVQTLTGVPDRCFKETTLQCVGYGEDVEEHNFVYLPIQGPDGRIWLNNNLGADYAKVDSPWFNPAYQAGALDPNNTNIAVVLDTPSAEQIKKDWRAYGSLFQWQRQPDGHELINWTNSTSGISKYGITSTSSNSWTDAGSNKLISSGWVNSSLASSGSYNLWQSSGVGKTNPCPSGYHVPIYNELLTLQDGIIGRRTNRGEVLYTDVFWKETVLRLSVSGARDSNGGLYEQSKHGWLWSSEYGYGTNAINLIFNSYQVTVGNVDNWTSSFGVRCIKDN